MHTYPFHAGDFLKDTAHFSEDESKVPARVGLLRDLAYRRLLDLYYAEEGPIPNKTHWVATRVRMLAHADIVGSVLKEKFVLDGGFWRQKRCDAEIAKYQKRVVANQENGKKGGRKPSGEPNGNPVGSKPRTRTRTSNTPLPPAGEAAFASWWQKYPKKVGKPIAMRDYGRALGRGATPEQIMAGLDRHIGCHQWRDQTKVPNPSTWLNRDGWNDEVAVPPGAGHEGTGNWWDTKKGILEKGVELKLPPPADDQARSWYAFMASVWVAAGDGPWWDDKSIAYPLAVRLRDSATLPARPMEAAA